MTKGSNETRPLQRMFSKVPEKYDFINRLFTLNLDGAWRAMAAEECMKGNPRRILDLCTGTGDFAMSMADRPDRANEIIGVDFSPPMIRKAFFKTDYGRKAALVIGDAASLPFCDRSFDSIGIAFAFRNLTYHNPARDRYLSEILRIMTPAGKFVIVESSQPRCAVVRALFHWYMRTAVSSLGGLISGQKGAYSYLAHSAINFYRPEELSQLLESAGFCRVEYTPLLFGVAAIHVAYKRS
jgi:demethylmenaquinone methyltransferase / 2-methoxy-6-polyprenyl-1,4-benzoquinol methylase